MLISRYELKLEISSIIKNLLKQVSDKVVLLCHEIRGDKDESINFERGDVILIDKEEIYYLNGNCKIIMVCTLAWYKEQCKLLDL